MIEIFQESLRPVNLPFSALLLVVVGYWLLVIVGGLTVDFLNIDLGGDDLDVSGGLSGKLASFFSLGDVPLMVVVTFFVCSMWAVTVLSNYLLNPDHSLLLALAWLGPNVIISVLMAKLMLLAITPLVRVGRASEGRKNLIGHPAVVTTSVVTESFGQVRVDQAGPPITLNARVDQPPHFRRGEIVRIVRYNTHNDTYVIEAGKPEKVE